MAVVVDEQYYKGIAQMLDVMPERVILCETARRLLAVVREADVVARLGGDEFVVVYEPSPTTVGTIIPRLEAALAPPIALGPTTFVNCPASIGHADTLTAGHDGSALIAAADAAMYEVKKTRDHTRHS